MAANNPYTSVSVSGYNASAPPDDGTRTTDNKVEWQKHLDKIGAPLKTGVEDIDTNVSDAFAALIITDDPAQEGLIEAVRRFSPRAPNQNLQLKRLLDRVEDFRAEHRVVGRAIFS